MFALVVFLVVFAGFVFFVPNLLGHTDNYIEANPLQTPEHIVPNVLSSILCNLGICTR